jgi:hypothetical protein
MQLSPKATRFVIEALEHYKQYLNEQLQQKGLAQDDVSDLHNDQLYLEAIKLDFEKYRDSLVQQREGVKG